MTLKQLAIKNRNFWWHVKDPTKLSESAIVEGLLNYGDMKEIKQLIKILGVKKTARIFSRQLKSPRFNYDKKTANYFKLYFKKHAR